MAIPNCPRCQASLSTQHMKMECQYALSPSALPEMCIRDRYVSLSLSGVYPNHTEVEVVKLFKGRFINEKMCIRDRQESIHASVSVCQIVDSSHGIKLVIHYLSLIHI